MLGATSEDAMPTENGTTWDDGAPRRDETSVRRRFWSSLKRVAADLPFAEDLVTAYYCAFDRDTPRHVQLALVGALAYFVLPFDIAPDLMPLVGFTDDAAVLAATFRLVAGHVTPAHRDAARRVLAGAKSPQ
jgi:uncharacterized membrane protein YkvA (DUF1232 family)